MATVFWFKVHDPVTGESEESSVKGTEAAIERIGSEKILGSAEEIDDALLDADGFYHSPYAKQP
jgi:hypothetical protein